VRAVHYINQFFSGIGGEVRADNAPEARLGPVGPGRALQRALGSSAEVVATVTCGDGRFADRAEETAPVVLALIEQFAPDIVVAGPAFAAGRYGLACGRVCLDVTQRLGLPVVTGMHPENVAVELYRRDVLIVPTAATVLGLEEAIERMAGLALKAGRGEPLGPPTVEGYLPQGRRMNSRVDRSASERALEMLLARLRGEPFTSEIPLPRYDRVAPPAALTDLTRARLALVTECGLVPPGNPDRLEWTRARKWLRYSLAGKMDLATGDYEIVHNGYDASFGLEDPNRLLPLDAVRELDSGGRSDPCWTHIT
jgi:betaine reductase